MTEVIDYKPELNFASLELRRKPKVSGGTVILDKGEVRAIIAGFDTIGYNRALFAKRQPGSVFKSLSFFAGLQLGWSVLDGLDNIRKVFPYQRNLYFPRPDHKNIYDTPSLLWSGVSSENLAAIQLMYGILDKVNFEQFQMVMGQLGLLPRSGERKSDYHYRLSKATGVYLTEDGIKEYLLRKTVAEILPDLVFSGEKDLNKKLRQLWWGRYHKHTIASLRKPRTKQQKKKVSTREIYRRIDLLENNFLHLKSSYQNFINDWRLIYEAQNQENPQKALQQEEVQTALANFRVKEVQDGSLEVGYYSKLPKPKIEEEEESEASEISNEDILKLKPRKGRKLTLGDVAKLWAPSYDSDDQFKGYLDKFKLLGYLPIDLFKRIQNSLEKKYEEVKEQKDHYLLTKFFNHHDFRVSLGLLYTVDLAKQSGIYNRVEPVLSLPLGTSDLTVGEIAKLYQTFMDGKTYRYYKEGPVNQLNFIRRIEDRFGNVIYEPQRTEHQLVSKKVVNQMREILRITNSHGTGRRARRELSLNLGPQNRIVIPSFGKTGTTNNFTTSYFSGSLPYPIEANKYLDLSNQYTIATYIGYDYNKSMKHGYQPIYGSSGALPAWIDIAKNIINLRKYKEYIDPLDLTILSRKEWPFIVPENTSPFLVDLPRGLVLRAGLEADKEIYRSSQMSKLKDYYTNVFIPNLKLNSVLYLPPSENSQNSNTRAMSLYKRTTNTF